MVPKGIFEMVAKTQAGLEEVLAAEIAALGGQDIQVLRRAVSYKGDHELLYKSNLWLRTAVRILIPFHFASARNADELYDRASRINWGKYLDKRDTFMIDCISSGENHHHSLFAAMKVKDAIADQFMGKFGERPSVDLANPTLRINLLINHTELIFSLDSSGDALQRRGYRLEQNEAPLNEVMAAGMILLTGWDGKSNFMDPMCGSGTLPIEAAGIAMNLAPGLWRKGFGFQNWFGHDAPMWERLVAEARALARPATGTISGSDIDPANVSIARRNIQRAGLSEVIQVTCLDFKDARPHSPGGILVMNPPYGERLEVEKIAAFYAELGDTMKKHFEGYQAWILSGNLDAIKRVGLKPSKKIPLLNGKIECRFHAFELYKGTREPKPEA